MTPTAVEFLYDLTFWDFFVWGAGLSFGLTGGFYFACIVNQIVVNFLNLERGNERNFGAR